MLDTPRYIPLEKIHFCLFQWLSIANTFLIRGRNLRLLHLLSAEILSGLNLCWSYVHYQSLSSYVHLLSFEAYGGKSQSIFFLPSLFLSYYLDRILDKQLKEWRKWGFYSDHSSRVQSITRDQDSRHLVSCSHYMYSQKAQRDAQPEMFS